MVAGTGGGRPAAGRANGASASDGRSSGGNSGASPTGGFGWRGFFSRKRHKILEARPCIDDEAAANRALPAECDQYGLHPALPAYLAAQWRAAAGAGFDDERAAARRALLRAYAGFGGWLLQQLQSGAAETALALLERQRRTMGQLLATALGDGLYAEAQAILRPLKEFWEARGLAEEADGWVDRVRQAVEGPGGAAPDFAGDAGALWLFAVGSEANRAINAGDLAGAEQAHDAIPPGRLQGARPSPRAGLETGWTKSAWRRAIGERSKP